MIGIGDEEEPVISIDTSGTIAIKERIIRKKHRSLKAFVIMDVKCPDSGESENMCWENIDLLQMGSPYETEFSLKFVIASKNDFDWAISTIRERNLEDHLVELSPAFGLVHPKQLAEWLLEEKTYGSVRMHLQLQKYVWFPTYQYL